MTSDPSSQPSTPPAGGAVPAAQLAALSDRFEGFQLLGQGAMGAVYLARERGSGRELAVKVLRDSSATRRARMLEREGALTASLDHPGIVRVHAAGEAGGLIYLAYELVRGARPLTPDPGEAGREAYLRRLREAAEAVGFAHSKGVVHRDLKPDNVLVDEQGRVRVADFGLAWAQGLERLTVTGSVLGTPLYMAPECFSGPTRDPRVDVWALGAMLYEGLVGAPPFRGDSLAEFMAAVSRGRFVPPRRLDATVARSIEAVCLRALANAPDRRYPDAAEFGRALEHALANAERPGVGRWGSALAAGVVLASLVAGGWALGRPEPAVKPALPKPRAGSVPRTKPDASERMAAARLDVALGEEDPTLRQVALRAWLAHDAGHPRADEAQRALTAVERVVPRLEIRLSSGRREENRVSRPLLRWLPGERLALSLAEGASWLRLWSADGASLDGLPTLEAQCGTLSRDGGRLAFVRGDQVTLLRVTEEDLAVERTVQIGSERARAGVTKACFTHDGGLWVGFFGGGVAEIDLATGEVRRELPSTREVFGLAQTADARWLLVSDWTRRSDEDGPPRVRLVDVASWTVVDEQVIEGRPQVFMLEDDRSAIVAGTSLKIWKLRFGPDGIELIGSFNGSGLTTANSIMERVSRPGVRFAHAQEVRTAAVWGGRLYSIGGEGTREKRGELRVWDLATRRELWLVKFERDIPRAIAAGPRGVAVLLGTRVLRVYSSD